MTGINNKIILSLFSEATQLSTGHCEDVVITLLSPVK